MNIWRNIIVLLNRTRIGVLNTSFGGPDSASGTMSSGFQSSLWIWKCGSGEEIATLLLPNFWTHEGPGTPGSMALHTRWGAQGDMGPDPGAQGQAGTEQSPIQAYRSQHRANQGQPGPGMQGYFGSWTALHHSSSPWGQKCWPPLR